jgi:molybdopterin-guanine dinucleotide biosynthesis protein MobB
MYSRSRKASPPNALSAMTFRKPVLGFAAFSGTGKTTLLIRLIPFLEQRGVRVALIKHAHHDFEIDRPGKDSYELRKAGARQVLVASERRSALMTDYVEPLEPRLESLVDQLALDAVDLVLVEGFRHVPFPKIELHRPSQKHPLLCREDASVIAVATDFPVNTDPLPRLDLNNPVMIGEFILEWMSALSGEHVNSRDNNADR